MKAANLTVQFSKADGLHGCCSNITNTHSIRRELNSLLYPLTELCIT